MKYLLFICLFLLSFNIVLGYDYNESNSSSQLIIKSPTSSMYDHASKSIYTIYAIDDGKQMMSLGSAVAISDHLLATNCHLVLAGDRVIISINNKSYLGHLYYAKVAKDFCVIKTTGIQLNPVQIRASQTVKIFEDAYAIGNPDGKMKAMSHGIISNKVERDGMKILQTSAALAAGSSGGGLFDKAGNLIGITTSGDALNRSINYAIPSELILEMIKNKNLRMH